MQQTTSTPLPLTIGLDLGARVTQCAVYSPDGERLEERKVSTTRASLTSLFERFAGARVVMEASTPARWIDQLARGLGHEVIVANPRSIPVITANSRKCDRNDARLLAEIGQVRPGLLHPVQLRADRYQAVRSQLFARAQLVKQRTSLINFVRAELKELGHCLTICSTKSFTSKHRAVVIEHLGEALDPILSAIDMLTSTIDTYDKRVEEISTKTFPEAQLLRQVHGVGPLVALAFVATIGDPSRFAKSRTVGAYLGLVPRMSQSCGRDPELPISKCGDRFMRTLLVSSATRILGPHGPDSDLRRLGERIASKGGQRSKARARIAVGRKLAVLLHRLLVTGEVYEPLRNSEPQLAA